MSAQPGWYSQPDGSQRYWDGVAWTQHTRGPSAAPVPPPAHPGAQQNEPASTGTPFYKNKVVIGVVAAAALLVGFSAMNGGGNQPSAAPEVAPVVTATATATATATVTVEVSAAATSTSPDPTEAASEEPTAESEVDAETAEPETFKMPRVVGKNLQLAQDQLQALGSWLMDQEDASGLGRFQILDSNWKVCSQKPKAGKVVPVDTIVVLESVKLGERCP